MSRRRQALALGCAVIALAVTVPSAGFAAGNSILDECTSGHLSGSYTVSQLRHALAIMPASQRQYTSCVDVVQAALLSARHHGGRTPAPASSGSGGSFLPTPVIIILVVLIVVALGFGAMALRRRRSSAPPPAGPPAPPGAPPA